MDLKMNCRVHPNEQALYLCTYGSCENIMFCYQCINNHSEHQKQLMNQSSAILMVQQVSSDFEHFQNLFKNQQNKNPDHQEQKKNDIIQTNIKYLKQLRQPIVMEQQEQQKNNSIQKVILIALFLIAILQITIISQTGNNLQGNMMIQEDVLQEPKEAIQQENITITNDIKEKNQQNLSGKYQCQLQKDEKHFSLIFDKFKHRELEIVDQNIVSLQAKIPSYYIKYHRVALSDESFDIHSDQIKATFQIQGTGIMIGICSHPIQSKTNYSFSKGIGHGCYLISDEGLMYHDVNDDFNNKVKIWTRFSSKSIVTMQYQSYFLEFKTNHGDEVQRIYLNKELQYYNIAVILSEQGSSVSII